MNRIFNEILLAGEVHNSACWSETYMEHVWERAKQLHCNAILAPIYWEQIEQEEGNYDFSLLDRMLKTGTLMVWSMEKRTVYVCTGMGETESGQISKNQRCDGETFQNFKHVWL